MATKVRITFKDKEGNEEVVERFFFGSEHLKRWVKSQIKDVINIEYIF